jgi:hypothetical protein
MKVAMNHPDVHLPYDDVLLPWALEHDPEVARIIMAVEAKAAKAEPPEIRPQSDERHSCENCGLPVWAVSGPGMSITIHDQAENRFQRTRTRTVWCHDDECAVQCLAISKYGRATHKWPITLAQFRATKPLEQFRAQPAGTQKRTRASRKAKDLVWGTSTPMATAKTVKAASLESGA